MTIHGDELTGTPAPETAAPETPMASRRNFVRGVLAATAGVAAVPIAAVATASAQSISASPGSPPAGYGTLQPVTGVSNVTGVSLLSGFTIRMIAESDDDVPGTNFSYRRAPDGAATFDDGNGGWYYTVNHELSNGSGGVTSIHFDGNGAIIGAQSICAGTNRNCAGGPTPWGTWLTCEENIGGYNNSGQTSSVWECWPDGSQAAVERPQMGSRNHEAVAVDPPNQVLYITEDRFSGNLWRFTPTNYPDLSSGVLEKALTSNSDGTGSVTWVSASSAGTEYRGGEGIWFHADTRKVYVATKTDDSIWELDTSPSPNQMERVWNGSTGAALYEPDNLTMAADSGDLYVAEDDGDLRVVLITAEGDLSTFLQFTGSSHSGSEVTGPVFNPAGDRMYVSSQRGGPSGRGVTYEISGPFRGPAVTPTPTPTSTPTVTPTSTPVPVPGDLSGTWTFVNQQYQTWLNEPVNGKVRHQSSQNRNEWEITTLPNGNSRLRNTATGRYMTTNGPGGPLVGSLGSATTDSEWITSQLAGGIWVIESAAHPGHYLDADAYGRLRLWDDTAKDAQWAALAPGVAPPPTSTPTPTPVGQMPGVLAGGTFTLVNQQYGTWLNEPVIGKVRHQNSQNRNEWEIIPLPNGRYAIRNVGTGRFIDTNGAPGSSTDPGQGPLVDSADSAVVSGHWIPVELANGSWLFESVAHPGFYLDADNFGRLRLWADADPDAQWAATLLSTSFTQIAARVTDPGEALRTASYRDAESEGGESEPAVAGFHPGMIVAAGAAAGVIRFRNRKDA